MNKRNIFVVLILIGLCTSCSVGQTYLKPDSVDAISSAEIVVLLPPEEIHLQIVGAAGLAGQGAIVQMFGELAANSRAEKVQNTLTPINALIEGESHQILINSTFSKHLNNVSWLSIKRIIFKSGDSEFNLSESLAQSSADTLILMTPQISLAPSMNFVEVRTAIEFYRTKSPFEKPTPLYEITAVAQSNQFNIPDLNEKKYKKKENVEKSVRFLSKDNGDLLNSQIRKQIGDAGRVALAAIEDASNKNLNDREKVVLTLKYFPYQYSPDKQKGYRLRSFETDLSSIVRPAPDSMNAPIGAPNVIYSVPKNSPIISIWNRY